MQANEKKINVWHRHKARRFVLQSLYQWELSGNSPREIEDSLADDSNFTRVDEDYFYKLFEGITSDCAALDQAIAGVADRDLDMMELMVKNILRISTYELMHCQNIPPSVSIDEALKLCHDFSTEDSPAYVHGIIDALRKTLRGAREGDKVRTIAFNEYRTRLNEFELIAMMRNEINRDARPIHQTPIDDDCALLSLPNTSHLAISTDALVEDVHFPAQSPPFLIGYRALCACVSDLAAMGAQPHSFLYALSIPTRRWQSDYLRDLAAGVRLASLRCGIQLIGGNVTTAPALALNMTVLGTYSRSPLCRRGATIGDLIFVSGHLGDAAGGLCYAQQEPSDLSVPAAALRAAYFCSLPRVALGRELRGLASSCIDLSDGLGGDLQQLLNADESDRLGARINVSAVPLSAGLRACFSPAQARQLALGASDDYELLFTAPPSHKTRIEKLGDRLAVKLTTLGEITGSGEILWMDRNQRRLNIATRGYRHGA